MTVFESEVDCLIVGAGPAGLMMATVLARYGVKVRIIDKRSSKLFVGQADGLQCRTIEVFDSFGFANRVDKEATEVVEVNFWNPAPNGGLMRTSRIPDTVPGTSRFPHYVLHQGRIEAFMIENMYKYGKIQVERCTQPYEISFDKSAVGDMSAHAITLKLRHLTETESTPQQYGSATPNGLFRSNAFDEEQEKAFDAKSAQPGETEIVHAKFVIGCDGARSWIREQLGWKLEGDSANYYWAVIDGIPVTNFPDIRTKVAIHSESSGSILILPREDQLVRFYVQMGRLQEGERLQRGSITLQSIIETAQKIMAPYTIDCPDVAWWTVYEVGQRVCPKLAFENRVFIAGDAGHTHSPKAGQGMNVSMMDTYNLGWKIGGVLKGYLDPAVLSTYESERHQIARELIEFDYKFSRLFSGKPAKSLTDEAGISTAEFEKVWVQYGKWTSGTAVDYSNSVLISKPTEKGAAHLGHPDAAPGIDIGMRFYSAQVVTYSDAKPRHIGDRLISDGRWRILAFVGDLGQASCQKAMANLVDYLDSPKGVIKRYTPSGTEIDSLIEVLTITSSPRKSFEYENFPIALRPKKGPHGYTDHCKVFSDEESYHLGHGHAYQLYGVDPVKGALVVVRPDQYVSMVTTLDDFAGLDTFFGGFMLSPTAAKSAA